MRTVIRPDVRVEKPAERVARMPKLLTDRRGERRSPGPSKLAYRLSRLWKKRWVRRVAFVLGPLVILGPAAWATATAPSVKAYFADKRAAVAAAISERPEFAIAGLRIGGASTRLARQIEDEVALSPGASSLKLDVAGLQTRIAAIPAVRTAHVKLAADKMLDVSVDERIAEALWRDSAGALWQVDREGIAILRVEARAAHPALPVVLGDGAPAAMGEALQVFRSAPDLQPRIRALVRVGQRRWPIVLDRGLTIFLPAERPAVALGRVMALQYGEELLDRGGSVIDMRLADRPTVRMTPEAAEIYRVRKATEGEEGEDT